MGLFRDLTPEEEVEFRQWARDNFKGTDEMSSVWHPVVRDECNKIINEYYSKFPTLEDVMLLSKEEDDDSKY